MCSEVTTRARQRPPAREPRRMARPARSDRPAAARRRCSGSSSAGCPKRTSRTAAAAVHLAAFDGRSCTRGGALKGWLRGGARGKRRARASASHASAREAARATPRRCRSHWVIRPTAVISQKSCSEQGLGADINSLRGLTGQNLTLFATQAHRRQVGWKPDFSPTSRPECSVFVRPPAPPTPRP